MPKYTPLLLTSEHHKFHNTKSNFQRTLYFYNSVSFFNKYIRFQAKLKYFLKKKEKKRKKILLDPTFKWFFPTQKYNFSRLNSK